MSKKPSSRDDDARVEIVRATPDPESLVCEAARNDYRGEGTLDYSFREIMADVDADEDHLDALEAEGWNWEDDGDPRELEAKKRTMLDHLMTSGHWGPFEHPQATVAIEDVTRVLMAQMTRHRHFTFDVMSLRYVGLEDVDADDPEDLAERFQFPPFIETGHVVDREGAHEIDSDYVRRYYKAAYSSAAHHYLMLLEEGVPQEQARKVLPMGTKVNIMASANARAWMHILNVRTKGNVQGETRRCAEAIFQALKEWMPYAFEKYDDDILPLKLNP